jgi:hypothetical protein
LSDLISAGLRRSTKRERPSSDLTENTVEQSNDSLYQTIDAMKPKELEALPERAIQFCVSGEDSAVQLI